MNETIDVSIAGIGFRFEPGAYEILRDYLDRVGRGYSSNPDKEEILNDIEARIVEIILTEQAADQIVEKPLINMVADRLGFPEEVDAGVPADSGTPERPFPKRLYRNPEGAIAGGVMSGLAAFFDADPSLLRLVFFLPGVLTLIFGITELDDGMACCGLMQFIFVVLYVLMWIVVPLARTPRQKLEMRGCNATASAIEQAMKADAGAMPRGAARASSVFSEFLAIIGRILVIILQIFVVCIGVVFAIASLGVLSAMLYVAINGDAWLLKDVMAGDWFEIDKIVSLRWDIVILLGVALIPFVMLSVLFFNILSKKRVPAALWWILGGLWLLAAGYSAVALPMKKAKLMYYYDANFKNRMVTSLDKAGFYVVKDWRGNIIVGEDTIAYAWEEISAEQLAERLNGIFGNEFQVQSRRDLFGNRMMIASRVPGPKYYESERAREEARQGGAVKSGTQNKLRYGHIWHERLPRVYIRYEVLDEERVKNERQAAARQETSRTR